MQKRVYAFFEKGGLAMDGTVHAQEVRAQVHACLRFLADRCDGATSLDQAGFSKVDTAFGRELAEAEHLTLAQVLVGARLIRKYRRQLEAGGLHAPTADEVDTYLEAQKVQAGRQEHPAALALPQGEESASRVYLHQDRIVVEFPFDRRIYNAVAPLKQIVPDWRFDALKRKEWSYPLDAAALVIDALAPFTAFVYGQGIAELVAQRRHEEALARELADLEEALLEREKQAALEVAQPYLQGAPLADGHALYAHQREAIRILIAQQRAILAHDLGLGKTRVALIAARSYGLPILVVAPAGLRINWLREAEAADTPIEIFSWAKVPEPPEVDYVLIGDECHYAQSLDAARTQAFLKLAEQAHAVFPVTGTPMKNGRPINLLPLLIAIRHPLAQDRRAYEEHYCAAYYRKVSRKQHIYDVTGASHLDELHAKIKAHVLYKKKEECLDLPPKIRVLRPAEVSTQAEKDYQKTLEHLRAEHERRMQAKREERLQALLEELGEESELIDLDELEADLAEADDNAHALVELGILRHAGSLAKIDSALEVAQEVLEEGGSIVLFTAYRDTAARIAQKLACDVLDGETPIEDRQRMIDDFQERKTTALVCTFGAGGVGITLTAAQTVVLVDRPWTPGDAVQSEDRLHRISQTGAVTAIWLQYAVLDEQIDTLLQRKQERISLVLEGKRKTLRGIKSVRSIAKEILESVRSGVPLEQLLGDLADQSDNEHDQVVEASPVAPDERQPIARPASMVVPREATSPAEKSTLPAAAVPAKRGRGQKDRRLKGEVPRVRMNVMLDEEIAAFLRSMKASHQATTKEQGYSGFLERLVRESPEFQRRTR